MAETLSVIMRSVHLSSVAALAGGAIYALLVAWPSLRIAPADLRAAIDENAAARFRKLVLAAIAGLTLSGVYNVLSNPGHSARYHMLLGIKLLLVAHIFAVSALAAKPGNTRRPRLLAGALASALAVIAISAYLRRIF